MNDTEVKELIEKLDNRYITKEEFQTEVFKYVSTRFATKGELLEAMGKMEAVMMEQSKSVELLQDLHDITIKNMEQMSRQAVSIEHVNKELVEMRRNAGARLWDNIPYPIRSIIAFIVIWVLLIISTTIIGKQADEFMRNNGLYVFFGNAIISLITSKNWGDKK